MFRPYVHVLRVPGAAWPLTAAFFGCLAINMQALAVLLFMQRYTGSFAHAGAVSAALSLGAAAGLLGQGRLLDRYGHVRVLVGAGAVSGAAMVTLVLSVPAGSRQPMVGLLAALAGAGIPAVPSAMRVLVPWLISDQELRRAAYALLAVQIQAATVAGPLLVSGLLVLAGPGATVLATAILAVGSAVAFAATSASRNWRPARPPVRNSRVGVHGIVTPGLTTLLVSSLGVGAVVGIVGVGIPAVAVHEGSATLAGLLLATAATGNILGGLAYGARAWRTPMPTQLVWAQAGEAVAVAGVWVAMLTVPAPLAWAPLLLVDGAVGAPIVIISSALLDTVSRSGALTESYTTLVAAILLGAAGGSYAAGALVENAGARSPFAAAVATWCVVAAWTFTRRQTLH